MSSWSTNGIAHVAAGLAAVASVGAAASPTLNSSVAMDVEVGSPSPGPAALNVPGTIVGYASQFNGLSTSVCSSTYPSTLKTPCQLTSFQAYDTPLAGTPFAYGNRIIHATLPQYSSKLTIRSVSKVALQNTSVRSVDLQADCGMNVSMSGGKS